MTISLAEIDDVPRLLFEIPLKPLQGERFQPTGFPSLGASTFQSSDGTTGLLVESCQSMANRLEITVWDEVENDVIEELRGISHVKLVKNREFLTDTILESHRLNSPYLLEGKKMKETDFYKGLKEELGAQSTRHVDKAKLARVLLKYDVGSLIHGIFIAKSDLGGGRLRLARALSAFIEASDVRVAASGGVKFDQVNPAPKNRQDSTKGFGNVPFARDEYTAKSITLYVNIDVAQIRNYGLGTDPERMLILLMLFKVRRLLDGGLRLRTACDLVVDSEDKIEATHPCGFELPSTELLLQNLQSILPSVGSQMKVTEMEYLEKIESKHE